jgi:hypothetical protein
MYFQDLSPYEYREKDKASNLFNIGWLDDEHDFPKGCSDDLFLDKILYLCMKPVNITRGYHICPFCTYNSKEELFAAMGYKTMYKGVPVYFGSAEIRVNGLDGKVYAAPTLIYHYIKEHGYLPPQEFIDAVERVVIE